MVSAAIAAGQSAKPAAQQPPNSEQSYPGYSDTPYLPGQKWRVHDIDRPLPRVVTPGAAYGQPPSDAIVLFDGKNLSHWNTVRPGGAGEPTWKVENGYMEARDGSLRSRMKFGDVQLHVEWASPTDLSGPVANRGNSGVLMMGRYEVQVFESYSTRIYADGGTAAIYGQWPPLVNASRKPGEWQTFEIVWEAPKFENGKLTKPAYLTLFHNGVLMHHRQEVLGTTSHRAVAKYAPHDPEEPLELQYHFSPVRFRNIWVRRLTS
jgi:hypothetical protein